MQRLHLTALFYASARENSNRIYVLDSHAFLTVTLHDFIENIIVIQNYHIRIYM